MFAGVRAEDMKKLRIALEAYPEGVSVAADGDLLLIELRTDDLGSLNRYLAGHGIYASHIARQHATLEQVFFQLTGAPAEAQPEMAGIA